MNIQEESIAPYCIEVDSRNHTVYTESKTATDKDGKPVRDVVGYFSTMEGALKKIAKLKTKKYFGEKVITIKSYLVELERISNVLKPLL